MKPFSGGFDHLLATPSRHLENYIPRRSSYSTLVVAPGVGPGMRMCCPRISSLVWTFALISKAECLRAWPSLYRHYRRSCDSYRTQIPAGNYL